MTQVIQVKELNEVEVAAVSGGAQFKLPAGVTVEMLAVSGSAIVR